MIIRSSGTHPYASNYPREIMGYTFEVMIGHYVR